MFAVYSAAAMSLSDDECLDRFHEPRQKFRAKLVAATKAALTNSNFMATSSMVVLQSLIIHIISAQDIYEPRALWTITGVAIRIAHGMGVQRDGTLLGLKPFDTEMRRRIWWLLKAQDQRSAELCGLAKFRDLSLSPDATKRPSNVNDDEIYPEMLALPKASNKLTDMTFLAMRYDLQDYAAARVSKFRQLGKDPSRWDSHLASAENPEEADSYVKEIEEYLEMKYLRHCDPSQPLQLLSLLMARAAVGAICFMMHHPRRWANSNEAPSSEQKLIWDTSVRLLEQREMLQSSPLLKRFAWQASFATQWHAFIHVLDTLRANPSILGSEKVWKLVESAFENNFNMLYEWGKPLHRVVGTLCLKAYDAAALTAGPRNQDTHARPTPGFILKLRRLKGELLAQRRSQEQRHCQATASQHDNSEHHEPSGKQVVPDNAGSKGILNDSLGYTEGLHDWQLDTTSDLWSFNVDPSPNEDGESNRAYQTIDWEQLDMFLINHS